jgi:hypothetical protein
MEKRLVVGLLAEHDTGPPTLIGMTNRPEVVDFVRNALAEDMHADAPRVHRVPTGLDAK